MYGSRTWTSHDTSHTSSTSPPAPTHRQHTLTSEGGATSGALASNLCARPNAASSLGADLRNTIRLGEANVEYAALLQGRGRGNVVGAPALDTEAAQVWSNASPNRADFGQAWPTSARNLSKSPGFPRSVRKYPKLSEVAATSIEAYAGQIRGNLGRPGAKVG